MVGPLAVFFLFFDRYMLGVENSQTESFEENAAELWPEVSSDGGLQVYLSQETDD